MILSVLNCQEAYRTDVRPLLAKAREEMDVPVDPIAAYLPVVTKKKLPLNAVPQILAVGINLNE